MSQLDLFWLSENVQSRDPESLPLTEASVFGEEVVLLSWDSIDLEYRCEAVNGNPKFWIPASDTKRE